MGAPGLVVAADLAPVADELTVGEGILVKRLPGSAGCTHHTKSLLRLARAGFAVDGTPVHAGRGTVHALEKGIALDFGGFAFLLQFGHIRRLWPADRVGGSQVEQDKKTGQEGCQRRKREQSQLHIRAINRTKVG